MVFNPQFHGALGVKPSGEAPPVPRSVSINPQTIPEITVLPATFNTTVTATGMTQVKWAVFQVSTSGQYTSAMVWQILDLVGGTASIAASIQQPRDVLVVKSLDDQVETQSSGAVYNPPPSSDTDGLTAVRNFIAPLTMGINIERGESIWNGWITTSTLQSYKNAGVTHVRFFPPSGGNFQLMNPDDMGWFWDAIDRALGVGLRVQFDLLDVMDEGQMAGGGIMPYLARCGEIIASKGWPVTEYAVGSTNEYAYGSNVGHQAKREQALATLRSKLPNSILVSASADWGSPWTLTNGTFRIHNDDRVLYQWHLYENNADQVAVCADIQFYVDRWATQNNVVTYCGEWGKGPPDGSQEPNYGVVPAVIDAAARGMGQQRPAIWTVTGGSYWRLNGNNTGVLRSEVANALGAGDDHIRAQAWYNQETGEPPPPSGGTVSRIQILHRGQSNAVFANSYGGDSMLREVMAHLTNLPVDMISRVNAGDDNTLHSGSYSFWDSPYNNDDRWLNVPGNNYGSSPSGWGNSGPLNQTLNAVSRYVSTNQDIPLIDLRLHWEYDLAMEDGASRAAYRNGAWEITQRIRATRAKAAGKHIAAYAYCPYQGGNTGALDDIHAAWVADLADAGRNVVMACGQMMDAHPNTQYSPDGDFSHWGYEGVQRSYPRIGFRLAKLVWEKGWCPSGTDLSDIPSMGPRITGASRSGISVNATIAHDRGSTLVGGAAGIDWDAFTYTRANGSHVGANGGAITGASSIRIDFPETVQSGGGLWHAYFPNYRRNRMIRDNWHSSRPAKFNNVPHIGQVEFPLQRTMSGVAL